MWINLFADMFHLLTNYADKDQSIQNWTTAYINRNNYTYSNTYNSI